MIALPGNWTKVTASLYLVKETVLYLLYIISGGGRRAYLRRAVTKSTGHWAHVDRICALPDESRRTSNRRVFGGPKEGFSSVRTPKASRSLRKDRIE